MKSVVQYIDVLVFFLTISHNAFRITIGHVMSIILNMGVGLKKTSRWSIHIKCIIQNAEQWKSNKIATIPGPVVQPLFRQKYRTWLAQFTAAPMMSWLEAFNIFSNTRTYKLPLTFHPTPENLSTYIPSILIMCVFFFHKALRCPHTFVTNVAFAVYHI